MLSLADALTRLRNLKSQISRVTEIVKSSVQYDEDQAPDYVFADELANMHSLESQIVELKARIQTTNALTVVEYLGRQTTLSELILVNAQVRSDLSFYQELLKTGSEDTPRYLGARTKDTIKKVYAAGYSKQTIRKTIEKLEEQKEALDSFLNATNIKTQVVTGP